MRDDKTLSFHSTSPYKTMGRNRGKHLTCIERPLLDLVSGRLTYHARRVIRMKTKPAVCICLLQMRMTDLFGCGFWSQSLP